jgi:flagellar biosynthesis protein FlhG
MEKEYIDNPFVITICSGKGGVGKSFITANLANILARKGMRVLVWDTDTSFPNQHILQGVEPPIRLSDVYNGNYDLLRAIYKINDNLDLLADKQTFDEIPDSNSDLILDIFKKLLINTSYDLILIDTPAFNSEQVLQCCNIADLICLIVTDEPTSLLDGYGLLKILLSYINKEYMGILINNVSQKLNMATEKFLKTQIQQLGFLPYDREVRQSILQQVLYSEIHEETELISAFEDVSNNILMKIGQSIK